MDCSSVGIRGGQALQEDGAHIATDHMVENAPLIGPETPWTTPGKQALRMMLTTRPVPMLQVCARLAGEQLRGAVIRQFPQGRGVNSLQIRATHRRPQDSWARGGRRRRRQLTTKWESTPQRRAANLIREELHAVTYAEEEDVDVQMVGDSVFPDQMASESHQP